MREPHGRADTDVAGLERLRSFADKIGRDADVCKLVLFGERALRDHLRPRHIGVEDRMLDMSCELRIASRGVRVVCARTHPFVDLFRYFLDYFIDVHR